MVNIDFYIDKMLREVYTALNIDTMDIAPDDLLELRSIIDELSGLLYLIADYKKEARDV